MNCNIFLNKYYDAYVCRKMGDFNSMGSRPAVGNKRISYVNEIGSAARPQLRPEVAGIANAKTSERNEWWKNNKPDLLNEKYT